MQPSIVQANIVHAGVMQPNVTQLHMTHIGQEPLVLVPGVANWFLMLDKG